MFGRLDYKKKCYVLFGGLLLFFIVGYKFSFSDTFKLRDEIHEKETRLTWLKEKEKELPELQARMQEFEKVFVKGDSGSVRDKLTAYISDFAERNNCVVTEIPHRSSFHQDKLQVQTNSFTVRGGFHKLLNLLYKMEHDHKYVSKIMSARFFSIHDLQTKKKVLYLTLILQSFEPKNSP